MGLWLRSGPPPEPVALERMSKRCIWSNRQDPGTREVELEPKTRFARPEAVQVCPAHESQVRKYHDSCERYGGWFLALHGLLAFGSLMLWALGVPENAVAGGLFIGVGVLVLVFPFATPQTVEMMGVYPSVLLVRVIGVGMIGGVILSALGVEEYAIIGGALTCFGVLLVVFPFATPQTGETMGVNPSAILVRVTGLGMAGWGIYLLASFI